MNNHCAEYPTFGYTNLISLKMKNTAIMKCLLYPFLLACLMLLASAPVKADSRTAHNVRVVSLCFPNKGLEEIARVVDQEASKGCDIIVLPETWNGQSHPETLQGETITTLAKLAQKHHTYILSPIDRTDGKQRLNSAVLIDRNGKVVFVYDKIYPYWGEFDLSPAVTPGANEQLVYDTDFGRIGIATCYDANFPEVWQALRDQGAQLILWPSAYSAGTQLQAYALLHHYYIVTSTQSRDCQVYDITGQRILDLNSGDITVARFTLDMDRSIYHENFNMEKLSRLLKDHGNEIEKEIHLPREQWFVLRSLKPEVSACTLAKDYGLETLTDYQDRSRKQINQKRGHEWTK